MMRPEIVEHEVVQLLEIDGKEYMCYKSVPLDICFLRGTYADEAGNISHGQRSGTW